MHIAIIASGTPCPPDFAKKMLEPCTAIIAVDGGIHLLIETGILPGLFVGDFDSTGDEVLTWLERHNIPQIRLKTSKDETDFERALIEIGNGEGDILVLQGTGGRFDHWLGNIQIASGYTHKSRNIIFADPEYINIITSSKIEVSSEPDSTVSILPLTESVTVSTFGLKWPLKKEKLFRIKGRGISNLTQGDFSVSVSNGTILITKTNTSWS